MVTSKQLKEVQFNYSPYLISLEWDQAAAEQSLCPGFCFPQFRQDLYTELRFFEFIHIHHTLKKKRGGGVKPEQTVLLSDKSESWKHKWIRKTNQYKSTSTESMENN